LKDPSSKRNIPIQAIGLSLYESLPGVTEEQCGSEVIRTQWLYDVIIAPLTQMIIFTEDRSRARLCSEEGF
jgi:hypothetical protein